MTFLKSVTENFVPSILTRGIYAPIFRHLHLYKLSNVKVLVLDVFSLENDEKAKHNIKAALL